MNRHRQQTPGQTSGSCAAAPIRAAVRSSPRKLGRALAWTAIGALILGPGAAQASASQASTATARATANVIDEPVAAAAREVNLQETGYLHSVGEPGETIAEQGHAIGTYNCSISVHMTIVSANSVTATFTVKPKGGSVTGRGSARFAQKGANGYFGGTIAITDGTGSYAHASGTDIGISGVINRETFALTVHVHGKIDL